ncbi:unnamed protein product [Ectocarpus sp. 4 AP-2014]
MVTCWLCAYRGPDEGTECAVCGQPHDRARDREQERSAAGSRLGQINGGLWYENPPQKPRIGTQAMSRCNSIPGGDRSTHLNPELRCLLDLIPEQQNRRKRAEDMVRATGARLTPERADGDGCDPDVVYIRPRVDPTMRVLKGRYKTQPRIAKSTSMSALYRLADPLMGYDSVEALAPKERTLRRESVERRLGQALASGNPGDGQERLLNTTRPSPSRPNNTILGRCSSGRSIPHQTPMAISVNAVSLQDRRQRSIRSTAVQQRRGYRSGSRLERSKTQEISASPLLRLRASGGRRAKPTLRRKRVATMRSVNGWVKEADPASMRRQNSLDRRFIALRKNRNRKPKGKRKDSRPLAHSSGATARDSRAFDGSTFLTEVETDVVSVPVGGTRTSSGDDRNGGWVGYSQEQRRRKGGEANPARQHPGGRRKVSVSGVAREPQTRGQLGRAGRGASSTNTTRRRSTEPNPTITGRGRPDVVQRKGGRTKSVGALHRFQAEKLNGGHVRASSLGRRGGDPKRRQPPPDHSGDLEMGRVVAADGPSQWAPGNPGEAWTLSPSSRVDISHAPQASTHRTTAELKLAVSTGDDTSAHGTSTTLAPAWGVPGSHSVGPLREDIEARLAWQENEAGTSSRPCNEWQLLRRNEKSSSRSAKILHSFENKVGFPLQLRQQHQPTSVASNDEPAAQLLLSENSGPGNRWHPPARSCPRRSDTKEPHPSESRLALMHHRPSSKSWVHRRSLPSLLSDTTEPPASRAGTPSTSTLTRGSPTAAAAGGGGAILRRRGRRRAPLEEPSGLMQQLDKNHAVTVGDTWGGGLSRRGAGKGRDEDDGGVEGVSGETEATGRGGTPSVVGCGGVGGDGTTLTAAARPGSRGQGSTSSGRLLSSAIPKPLLYVGSGGGFRLRS